MWKGGFEGGEYYYNPQGVSPLRRDHHHTAGSPKESTLRDPNSPKADTENAELGLRSHAALGLSFFDPMSHLIKNTKTHYSTEG